MQKKAIQLGIKFGVADHQGDGILQPLVQPIGVSRSTFKGGLAIPVHRWFRLTPSFGPDLVDEMIQRLNVGPGDCVLDPFAGASTTLIQCKRHGIESGGFEINPLLHFVGKTCLNWRVLAKDMQMALASVLEAYTALKGKFASVALESTGLEIPPIHNIDRWWRRDVLRDLLLLRECIEKVNAPHTARDALKLGILAVLVPNLTNVTLGRLQLHFIDRSNDEIDVLETFTGHMKIVLSDYAELQRYYGAETVDSDLIHGDSTTADQVFTQPKFSAVITSPPYPNRYSYVWNTRPHLYFGRFINTAREASSLDLKTIGGTWGVATSILSKGVVEPRDQIVKKIIGPICDDIRKQDSLMANYCMKYFNMLTQQIETLKVCGRSDLRLAYVVGCSRIKGVFVETDVLLAKLLENHGYKQLDVVRFRKRHSDKDLHESVVYAWR